MIHGDVYGDSLSLRLECSGADAADALCVAMEFVQMDIARGILPAVQAVRCYRLGMRESIPNLVGSHEMSIIFGVTRQRVSQLAKHAEFPLPVIKLAMGPVFSESAVRSFEERWVRKTGRPRLASNPAGFASIVAVRNPNR